jgi:RND family efflux transporter MFP subunit
MRRWMTPLIAIVIAVAALMTWRSESATDVRSVTIGRGTAAEVVYATGTVEPRRWAKVISMQRKRIIEICDCEGETVRKGDVLARLDDAPERAALAELQARSKRLELDTQRIKSLVDKSAATQTSYEQTLTQLQEYQARIDAQNDRINELVLRAPMDGVVLRRDGQVGEIAGVGATDVLFWIGERKPLRVVADVNEDDIPRVKVGQKALLRSEGFAGQTLEASVADITPKGDPVAKTFRVYLSLPDDTPLRIGMSVEANIVVREAAEALLVPSEAVINGTVFRINGDRLERVAIKTGIRGTRMMEVQSGLDEGMRIASPAKPDWRDRQRVHVTTP